MSKNIAINWLAEPEEMDYPVAESYLSLLYRKKMVKVIVAKLQKAPVSHFKVKDIFRASGLSLMGVSNYHVEKDSKRIDEGKSLSPVLLVRDEVTMKVIVAEGYHRMCAVYMCYEDALIPCKIV